MFSIIKFRYMGRFNFAALRSIAILSILVTLFGISAQAKILNFRWEYDAKKSDELATILEQLKSQSGLNLAAQDFSLVEEKMLATSRFKTYAQVNNGVAIKGALLRTWAEPKTGALIQMEAHLDDGSENQFRQNIMNARNLKMFNLTVMSADLNNFDYIKKVVLKHPDDRRITKIEFTDRWTQKDLERVIKVRGKHGTHVIVVSHLTKKIKSAHYELYPQAEMLAYVYPIYEEAEKDKGLMDREYVILKNISNSRKLVDHDPYESLRTRRYFEDMIDPVLGETEEGRAAGYWSPRWLLAEAQSLFNALPDTTNDFSNTGIYLQGTYATINLHPDAISKFQGLNFSPAPSGRLAVLWKSSTDSGSERWEVVPNTSYFGQPLTDELSALNRVARRSETHNPVQYMNDGFDEIQVYYAINRLMESLHAKGFDDPELSTRPFHAYLYDPDISMIDNAYYTADTINFTTYSPKAQNYARDNSTIWHELGHGVMDRLMGDLIQLTDSGGLSEGMADFIAQIVIQDVTHGKPFKGSDAFRINNKIGFNLTNESHDDGEAYGGAMNDMMLAAIQNLGNTGLAKFSDLTMETMRLTRNNPGLDANGWFEHMLYADQLGRLGVRAPGEMRKFILDALRTRNFNLDRSPSAQFMVLNGENELDSTGDGSRRRPITHTLSKEETATHELDVRVKSSEGYPFKYPVTIEVGFNGGPLQGAVKWLNEENGPLKFVLNSESESVKIPIGAKYGCDFVNREDGSCSDFAYIKVINAGETLPSAKKRFYLRIYPTDSE